MNEPLAAMVQTLVKRALQCCCSYTKGPLQPNTPFQFSFKSCHGRDRQLPSHKAIQYILAFTVLMKKNR